MKLCNRANGKLNDAIRIQTFDKNFSENPGGNIAS